MASRRAHAALNHSKATLAPPFAAAPRAFAAGPALSLLWPRRTASRPASLLDNTRISTLSRSPLQLHQIRPRAYATGSSAPSDSTSSSKEGGDGAASLTQRLKVLFRKHGWTALSVYLLLSALDFGLTFVLIYAVGADRVREAEDWVLDTLGWRRKDGEPGKVKRAVEEWKEHHPRISRRPQAPKDSKPRTRTPDDSAVATARGAAESHSSSSGGNAAKSDYSAFATTAVLAYAIHKTLLLPVRVGITIAVTPRIVRVLQSWGWNVGVSQPGTLAGAASAATKSSAGP
ncbi:hypothetical protein ACM66B_000231 [Microbotryomycetes sp. NB124-2]